MVKAPRDDVDGVGHGRTPAPGLRCAASSSRRRHRAWPEIAMPQAPRLSEKARFEVPGGPIDTSKLAAMVGGWR